MPGIFATYKNSVEGRICIAEIYGAHTTEQIVDAARAESGVTTPKRVACRQIAQDRRVPAQRFLLTFPPAREYMSNCQMSHSEVS
jgi:hypothetical protein